jgi:DHA2 family multidrug resistance protein
MGVMLGPILGPTLGGFLTDAYNWRWIFYINVPFGIAAVAALSIFFKDTVRDHTLKFDWFGFGALSVGLASLQLLLDRGVDKGWFTSPEIVIEGIISGTAFYLFLVHMATGKKTFIPLAIFKDRNFVGGLVLMFVMGLVLLASSALLSPYLQSLAGYSVTQTGFLMVPRGFGVMFAMLFAGRLTMKMDPRLLMTVGACFLVWSVWEMTGWTPSVSTTTLTSVTFIQGLGMGLVFVPMNLVAFATLGPQFRTDGAGLTNLMRNIGSAVGVSLTTTVLSNSVQTIHAQLSHYAAPFNRALGVNGTSMFMNPLIPFGMGNLNGLMEYRAQVQAYANSFLFMFYIALPVFAVIWMMKRPTFAANAPKPKMEVVE